MTAIGESALRNLDHGDNAINPDGTVADSVGLFQQQERGYGPLADRMDPFKAATAFFTRLMGVPGWQTMEPTLAAHAVQINADPNYYTPFYAPANAIVQGLVSTGVAGAWAIGGDAVQLAQQLVDAADQGRLIGSTPDHTIDTYPSTRSDAIHLPDHPEVMILDAAREEEHTPRVRATDAVQRRLCWQASCQRIV